MVFGRLVVESGGFLVDGGAGFGVAMIDGDMFTISDTLDRGYGMVWYGMVWGAFCMFHYPVALIPQAT